MANKNQFNQNLFLELVPTSPDFTTTEDIRTKASKELKKEVNWNTAHKYLNMLLKENKIRIKRIGRQNHWTRP